MKKEYWLIPIPIMYTITLTIALLLFDYVDEFIVLFIFFGFGCILSLPFLKKYEKGC